MLVFSCDINFPAITIANNLRRYNRIRLVSDQHINIDDLHPQLGIIGVEPALITMTFVTGGCDFKPYLKHIPQAVFVVIIIKYSFILQKVWCITSESQSDNDSIFTHVLVSVSFYEHSCITCATLAITISRPPAFPK